MDTLVKETLEKQLKLLSERSEKAVGNEVAIYTEQIVKLANLLDPELRNRPYVEALSRLPLATLTMSDLEEIAVARKEKIRRADEEFRRLLDEHRKTTPNPRPESADTPASPL